MRVGSKRIFYRSVKLLLATSTSTAKQAKWTIGTVFRATCGQGMSQHRPSVGPLTINGVLTLATDSANSTRQPCASSDAYPPKAHPVSNQ